MSEPKWVSLNPSELVGFLGPTVAHADLADARMLAETCHGCHGPNGVSMGPAAPTIAGFDRQYLIRVLQEFREDERESTIMGRIMTGYRPAEIRRMASYFAAQTWASADVQLDRVVVEQGRAIHEHACVECHQDGGRHQDRDTPRIAGQWPIYLLFQLESFRDRPTSIRQPSKMREALEALSDDDLGALAQYYASER
ncbi:c-type cytochrome [Thiocapsa imhoffii]